MSRDTLLSIIFYLSPFAPFILILMALRDDTYDIAVSTESLLAFSSAGKLKAKLDWSEVESVTVKNTREGAVYVVAVGKSTSISWSSSIEGFSELVTIVR